MNGRFYSLVLRYFFISVWLANGLLFKILNIMPRHEVIVANILSADYARLLIVLIGCGEILIALWIFSQWKSKICTWFQILLVLSMNIIEFCTVQDTLMFGPFNLVIAVLFCVLLYYSEFILKPNADKS